MITPSWRPEARGQGAILDRHGSLSDAAGQSKPAGLALKRSMHFVAVGTLVASLAYIATRVACVVFVTEGSMVPTINPGERVLVYLGAYNHRPPQRGDVVLTDRDTTGERQIKRVIGVPGDVIVVAYGLVYRNGELLKEPYVHQAMLIEDPIEVRLREGELFLMGDNRNVSDDSRDYGPVPLSRIAGRACWRLLPLGRMGHVR